MCFGTPPTIDPVSVPGMPDGFHGHDPLRQFHARAVRGVQPEREARVDRQRVPVHAVDEERPDIQDVHF